MVDHKTSLNPDNDATDSDHSDSIILDPSDILDNAGSDHSDYEHDDDEEEEEIEEEEEQAGSSSKVHDQELDGLQDGSTVNKPSNLCLKDQIFDIAFHPNKNYIATAEIDGRITIFSYSTVENKKLIDFKHHSKACRCLEFSPDGNKLYTCSKDKSLKVTDMNTGANIHSIQKAHEKTGTSHKTLTSKIRKALNQLKVLSENYLATGCDNGTVKVYTSLYVDVDIKNQVWDTRTFSTIAEFSDRKDYISDMESDKERRHLLCTSGDGYLSVYNLRKKKLEQTSDQLDEELLSIAIVKNGQKVVCGSGDGSLNIYSWGEWGDISDRVPSKNDSIDSICAITDDIICTGSDDGCIRSMFIQPHRALNIVGKHGTLGIENLKLSSDKQYLASCASENTVKFWDMSCIDDESIAEPEQQKKNTRKRKMEEDNTKKESFFADL